MPSLVFGTHGSRTRGWTDNRSDRCPRFMPSEAATYSGILTAYRDYCCFRAPRVSKVIARLAIALPLTGQPSQLRGPDRVEQVFHFEPRPIRKQGWIWPVSIPGPFRDQFGRQFILQHLHHIPAEHREEFEAMEVATGCDVQTFRGRVWRNDEVGAGGEGIPFSVSARWCTTVRVDVDLPTDPVFLHLPSGTVLAIEYLVRMIDVFLQSARNLPLCVIRLSRRR